MFLKATISCLLLVNVLVSAVEIGQAKLNKIRSLEASASSGLIKFTVKQYK